MTTKIVGLYLEYTKNHLSNTQRSLIQQLHALSAPYSQSCSDILLLLCFKCGINDLRHGDDSLILLTLPYKLQCDGCVFERLRGIV